jgi:hypothetical protein
MSLKIHFPRWHLDFFSEKCDAWRRKTFPSRYFFSGEDISREIQLCYARRLLLDFGKGCPYHGMQATGKTKKNHMILFVLNN